MGTICIEKATGLVREWARHGLPGTYDQAIHDLIEQETPPPEGTKWDGAAWVPFVQPKDARTLDKEDARAKIDDVLADPSPGPAKFKAAFAALRKVLV